MKLTAARATAGGDVHGVHSLRGRASHTLRGGSCMAGLWYRRTFRRPGAPELGQLSVDTLPRRSVLAIRGSSVVSCSQRRRAGNDAELRDLKIEFVDSAFLLALTRPPMSMRGAVNKETNKTYGGERRSGRRRSTPALPAPGTSARCPFCLGARRRQGCLRGCLKPRRCAERYVLLASENTRNDFLCRSETEEAAAGSRSADPGTA